MLLSPGCAFSAASQQKGAGSHSATPVSIALALCSAAVTAAKLLRTAGSLAKELASNQPLPHSCLHTPTCLLLLLLLTIIVMVPMLTKYQIPAHPSLHCVAQVLSLPARSLCCSACDPCWN
jgi:hypothetical protein